MQLEERVVGDAVIVRIAGDITLKKGDDARLNDRIGGLIQQGHKKVLLDLAGVGYVDSAGLGQLVMAHSTLKNHGGTLRVFNLTGRLRQLMVLTKLTSLLQECDGESQADKVEGASAQGAAGSCGQVRRWGRLG